MTGQSNNEGVALQNGQPDRGKVTAGAARLLAPSQQVLWCVPFHHVAPQPLVTAKGGWGFDLDQCSGGQSMNGANPAPTEHDWDKAPLYRSRVYQVAQPRTTPNKVIEPITNQMNGCNSVISRSAFAPFKLFARTRTLIERNARRKGAQPTNAGCRSRCLGRRALDRAWVANRRVVAPIFGSLQLQAPTALPERWLHRQ